LSHLFALQIDRPFKVPDGTTQVTVLLLFLPKVGILRGVSRENFACVSSAPLRSITPQLRIRERQLRFGVDPKMKSADADAQKEE
jgi:hypothetical protein